MGNMRLRLMRLAHKQYASN